MAVIPSSSSSSSSSLSSSSSWGRRVSNASGTAPKKKSRVLRWYERREPRVPAPPEGYNGIDAECAALARKLADRKQAWKACALPACRRARRCVGERAPCQGVRACYASLGHDACASFAFLRDIERRVKGKKKPPKRVRSDARARVAWEEKMKAAGRWVR
jgi:hypothetical protein